MKHHGTFHRKYKGDKPGALQGIVEALSYHLSNMEHSGNDNVVRRLHHRSAEGEVTVSRHGFLEIIETRRGGKTYFEIKIFRDDGRWIGESGVYSIEVFTDEILTNWNAIPILYLYNYLNSPSVDSTDTLYSLSADGSRVKKRYNEGSHSFVFDGYQKSWQSYWGEPTSTPKKVPYVENGIHHYGEVWDGGKYERVESATGYFIRVRLVNNVEDWPGDIRLCPLQAYYRVPSGSDPEWMKTGKFYRGYKLASGRPDPADATFVNPGSYVLRYPYVRVYDSRDPEHIDDTLVSNESGFISYYPASTPYPWPSHPFAANMASEMGIIAADGYSGLRKTYVTRGQTISSVPYRVRNAVGNAVYGLQTWAHPIARPDSFIQATTVRVVGDGIDQDFSTGSAAVAVYPTFPRMFTPVDMDGKIGNEGVVTPTPALHELSLAGDANVPGVNQLVFYGDVRTLAEVVFYTTGVNETDP